MAQSIFAGMTSYEDQSIEDVISDIKSWIAYTEDTKEYLLRNIDILKENRFWDNIPLNFQATLLSSIRCQNTFLHDLKLIMNAIEQDQLSTREVNLMKKIGINSIEYNINYGKSYKDESDWKKYGDSDFKIAENLYAKGRDYFITMQDASNLSSRLNDYLNPITPTVNQSVHQTINGTGHVVAGFNNGTINKTEMNTSQFPKEVESALHQIESVEDVDITIKNYIVEILKESKEAIENGDLNTQTQSKMKMKSFLIGAGVKASKIVNLLGTYASIASYYKF